MAIARDRHLSLITGLGVVQTFTRGCLTVFAVVVAIQLLDLGNPGVAVLNGALAMHSSMSADSRSWPDLRTRRSWRACSQASRRS
ncbi:MAG: hypothetical protein ACRDPG_12680 [Nocardioidaceae bacterium]